jgi:3-isopropylmalate/(R)-2-methylmalate dehydratase small subunit
MKIRGRVIKYGDHIDTDVIIAGHRLVHGDNIKLISKYAMESVDEKFHQKIAEGKNIIIAGRNFGSGSSRQQAPEVIKESGVKLIIADSIARIFFRNSINIGLPLLIADGISSITNEGDLLEVDLNKGIIKNLTNNKLIHSRPIPQFLMEILNEGGLVNHLRKKLKMK